jgi:hypothetical protein
VLVGCNSAVLTGEIGRRLLLEHLLWAESERNLIESVRSSRRALSKEKGRVLNWTTALL